MRLIDHITLLGASSDSLIFNPYAQLDAQMASASRQVSAVFDEIDSALDRGEDVVDAVRNRKIQQAMNRIIGSARLSGFIHGARHTKQKMPFGYGTQIVGQARSRARKVNSLMNRTSRRVLRNSPDSDYVLGKDRAIAAVRFEGANSYFAGVKDAFRGSGFKKRWVTSSGESCEDCQDNEDQGPIGVDELFQSGDYGPTLHLCCVCYLEMIHAH